MSPHNTSWEDDNTHPTKGPQLRIQAPQLRVQAPQRPTEFFQANFKLSAVGSVFRTVKAQFSPKVIHAEAAKAGWVVDIQEEGPWLKVKVLGKVKR